MTRRERYAIVLGRATARVNRGWTKGAYSRHPDGRALRSYGIRAATVDIVGAIMHTAYEYELDEQDIENIRYLVTAELPEPYCRDIHYGLERFNDAEATTIDDVVEVMRAAKETYVSMSVLGVAA